MKAPPAHVHRCCSCRRPFLCDQPLTRVHRECPVFDVLCLKACPDCLVGPEVWVTADAGPMARTA